MKTSVRFTSYPRTEPPPQFIPTIVEAFRSAETQIGSEGVAKGLTSDAVLAVLHAQLEALGFQVEKGKVREGKEQEGQRAVNDHWERSGGDIHIQPLQPPGASGLAH